jgi:hypothetical protein
MFCYDMMCCNISGVLSTLIKIPNCKCCGHGFNCILDIGITRMEG